jgi:PadR family transcriptional regulator PadR
MRKYCSQVVVENFFEPCVLFLLSKKPSYGYELNKNLLDNCDCQVNIGNLYRGLNRLVREKYIKKTKSKSSMGPDRTTYEITQEGKVYLASWIEGLEKQSKTINKLINNYKKSL